MVKKNPTVDSLIDFAQHGQDPQWVLAYAATAIAMLLREQHDEKMKGYQRMGYVFNHG